MNVFIVEDEPIARERLIRLLKEIGNVNIVGVADSKEKALSEMKDKEIDVLFLDIKLPDGTGLEIAKEVIEGMDNPPYIIFATANGDFALDAFKANAIDYLLKPFTKEDVEKALEKIKNIENKSFNLAKIATITTNTEILIPVKHLSKIVLLKPDDIYYIKAELSETVIRTKDKEYISNRKLYEFEDILKYKGFFRVHKSYLVNLTKIKEMKSVEQSKFLITFQDIPDTLKTSRDGAKYLRDYLNI